MLALERGAASMGAAVAIGRLDMTASALRAAASIAQMDWVQRCTTYTGTEAWKTGNCMNSASVATVLTTSTTEETNMRTKITFYGETAGNIWMPAVECTKAFRLQLTRS